MLAALPSPIMRPPAAPAPPLLGVRLRFNNAPGLAAQLCVMAAPVSAPWVVESAVTRHCAGDLLNALRKDQAGDLRWHVR